MFLFNFFSCYFVECRSATLIWQPVRLQPKELSTHFTQAETAWHVPSHTVMASFFISFLFLSFLFFVSRSFVAWQAPFYNVRQEQMKRTCLRGGGKCQLLYI